LTAVISWSGGKDSCLALYRAVSAGVRVTHMLNLIGEDSRRSMSHGLPPELIGAQARALGIELVQIGVSWDTYEREFCRTLADLKAKGVDTLVTGDIDLPASREWNERICSEIGIGLRMPLWGEAPEAIMREFLEAGFQAVVVCCKGSALDAGWIGRGVDGDFAKDLLQDDGLPVHLCGEGGEYHTVVVDGPLFGRSVRLLDAACVHKDGYWFLDIRDFDVEAKPCREGTQR